MQPDNRNCSTENNNADDSTDSASNGNVFDDQASLAQTVVDVLPMDELDPEASNGSSIAMDEGALEEPAQVRAWTPKY